MNFRIMRHRDAAFVMGSPLSHFASLTPDTNAFIRILSDITDKNSKMRLNVSYKSYIISLTEILCEVIIR